MATITTSWQRFGSATLTTGVTIYLYGKYTKQSVANNTTECIFQLQSEGYQWRTTNGTAKFTGDYTDSKSVATYPSYITNGTVINEITKTITHNSDGTKSISLGGVITATLSSKVTATISNTTITMPKIDRIATTTKVQDFNDEGTTTVTFTNPGNFTTKPYINFYNEAGQNVYQLYRNYKVNSPFTWDITDAERTAIRNACNQQQTYYCYSGVDTYNGSTKLGYSSLRLNFTIVNANPEITLRKEETNPTIINYLGTSADTVIKNVSQVKLTPTTTLKKGATLKTVTLKNGTKTVSTEPFVVTDNMYYGEVVDSRTLYGTTLLSSNIIDYEPVNIDFANFRRINPTSSNFRLDATFRYFQISLGSANNVPNIQYKLNEDGELHTISSDNYEIDTENHKITINNLIFENFLSYTQTGTFYLYINDLLSSTQNQYSLIKGIPTFDAGEHDFNVNGDLTVCDENGQNKINIKNEVNRFNRENYIDDLNSNIETGYSQYHPNTLNSPYKQNSNWGRYGSVLTLTNDRNSNISSFWAFQVAMNTDENASGMFFRKSINQGNWTNWEVIEKKQKVLWSGAWYMTSSHSASLSEKVSEQTSGIVIAWSRYSGGQVGNYEWVVNFYPKQMVALRPGDGYSVVLNSETFGKVGGKYIYIHDDHITGHDNNETNGTNNGITYNNRDWVMRYVIGV